MSTNFDNLDIKNEILKGIYLYGFKEPSIIQKKGIETINSGSDCILQSQSGTGKTGTYLIGVFNKIICNNCLQCIIVTPTRELAKQVYEVAIQIAKFSKLKIDLVIGGSNSNYILNNTNLVIGTLGRLNHIFLNKNNKLNFIKMLVIDEADNMFYNGMPNELQNILNKINHKIQKIFISATLSKNIFELESVLLDNPKKILLKKDEIAVDLISQFYIDVEIEDYKFDVLLDLYNIMPTTQVIIFCNTIRKVIWLNTKLTDANFLITTIHGGMTQDERNEIVKNFRDGKTRLLLTTDLLARGIDIPQVNLVINYDLPISKETYIHRIGRCGRFGKKGVSITMIKIDDQNDMKILNKMRNYYKLNINELPENIETYI